MIAIIDYGMGNLRSVQKGFEKVGHAATITSDPEQILSADRVILPGVGAFEDAMHELRARGLVEPVRQAAASGRPFLGICLGLQLLFDVSYEGGRHEGLGILAGEVVLFTPPAGYKVPHMGWNQLAVRRPTPILEGLSDSPYMYFVHSYYAVPQDRTVVAAEANYPEPFAAVVWRDNVFATQFHPEKSQHEGLQILRNFAGLPALAMR
ncbi:MAG TPA: imidazole glycerol phosphate synthase subunit HisH [Pirellulales bacterium]|jgi:glutamine amidotransferase